MKTNNISISFLVVVCAILLGGCAFNAQLMTPSFTPTSSPVSLTPSVTSSPTLTPTITPTLTAVPTLLVEDAYIHLRELLNTANCRLPCWMGITPGQSTLVDVNAQSIMFSDIATWLSFEPTYGWSTANLAVPYLDDNMVVEISPNYLIPPGTSNVLLIAPNTRTYRVKNGQYNGDVYGYSRYDDLLKPYTLTEVLSSHGLPDHIYVFANLRLDIVGSVSETPAAGDHFIIHLLYPDHGILLQYNMDAKNGGDNYLFCPSNALISGYFMPSSHPENFYTILRDNGGDFYKSYPPVGYYSKTPETAFGITDEEFYQLYRYPTNQCLVTPKSIWWPEDQWNDLNKNP